jgi:CubicO group peptidase (beta-lactamase class C family)
MKIRNALALLVVYQISFAQQPPSVASQGDVSSEAERHKQVDSMFVGVNTNSSPGCSVSVMRDGTIMYARGYGMADLDHGLANTPDSVYHVASMSKQFTAAAIQLLASEGKLTLDDSIRKFIPEFPEIAASITLRKLLNHTSGIRDQWDLLGLAGWRYSLDLITDDDVMSVLIRQRELNFPPNTRFLYSNSNYTLLAQVVKRVSGMSLRQFTTTRIFEPLGMTHTHFRDDHAEIVPDVAYGYERAGNTFRLSVTNFDTVGATSLMTTVRDLALWDENFYRVRVLNAELLKQMTTPGRLANGTVLSYGLGLTVGTYRGLATVSHAGADAGYRSELVRFPDQHFSVACLCNLAEMNPSVLTLKIADIYLADKLEPEGAAPRSASNSPVDPSALARWTGSYLDRAGARLIRITLDAGILHAHLSDGPSAELQPIDATHVVVKEFPVQIELVEGSPTVKRGLIMSPPGGTPARYDWMPPSTPSGSRLAEYTGTYYSEEVESRWRIAVEAGQLMLSSIKLRPAALTVAGRDVFTTSLGGIRFLRNSSGKVYGLTVSTGRANNVRFTRTPP